MNWEGTAKYDELQLLPKKQLQVHIEKLCSLQRIIIFKAFIEELITKHIAHKTLHHAFQFFKYTFKNFISQHMFWGKFLHYSKPMMSQSSSFQQFSSRSTWNPVTSIFFQYEEYTFWIYALNFSFPLNRWDKVLFSGYCINTTKGFCSPTGIELSSKHAQGPNLSLPSNPNHI